MTARSATPTPLRPLRAGGPRRGVLRRGLLGPLPALSRPVGARAAVLAGRVPAARGAVARLLAGVAAAVVRVVEAGALEVDGRGEEDALRRLAADLAHPDRLVAHALGDLEVVAVAAAVLVDGQLGSLGADPVGDVTARV